MKWELGVEEEHKGENRDEEHMVNDEECKVMTRPGPSDPDQILTMSKEQWYTYIPSLSPTTDLSHAYTPIPTPLWSPLYLYFCDYQGEPLTEEEADQELNNDPMWHWGGPLYFDGPVLRIQDNWLSLSPHLEEEAAPQQEDVANPIPGLVWLDYDNGNLIYQVTTYVADANKAMEWEGPHRGEQGQETAWGQTREGSPDCYPEMRAKRYKRDL
jgi:hypothetical protein